MDSSQPPSTGFLPTLQSQLAEASRLFDQGIRQTSQYRQAVETWQQALEIYRSSQLRQAYPQESRISESSVLGNLGNAYVFLSQYQSAIECLQQALAILKEVEEPPGEEFVLMNSGVAHDTLIQPQRTFGFLQQALPAVLINLGIAYSALTQPQQAIDYY